MFFLEFYEIIQKGTPKIYLNFSLFLPQTAGIWGGSIWGGGGGGTIKYQCSYKEYEHLGDKNYLPL